MIYPESIYYYKHNKNTRWDYVSHDGVDRPELYHILKRKEPGKKIIYLNKAKGERKENSPDQSIFRGTNYISGLFEPDITHPGYGYGDIKGTEDALLTFRDSESETFKIMVFPGRKKQKEILFQNWLDGGVFEAISYNKVD